MPYSIYAFGDFCLLSTAIFDDQYIVFAYRYIVVQTYYNQKLIWISSPSLSLQ